jgi:hypothetical protein
MGRTRSEKYSTHIGVENARHLGEFQGPNFLKELEEKKVLATQEFVYVANSK